MCDTTCLGSFVMKCGKAAIAYGRFERVTARGMPHMRMWGMPDISIPLGRGRSLRLVIANDVQSITLRGLNVRRGGRAGECAAGRVMGCRPIHTYVHRNWGSESDTLVRKCKCKCIRIDLFGGYLFPDASWV
jgi:hypothetical protein